MTIFSRLIEGSLPTKTTAKEKKSASIPIWIWTKLCRSKIACPLKEEITTTIVGHTPNRAEQETAGHKDLLLLRCCSFSCSQGANMEMYVNSNNKNVFKHILINCEPRQGKPLFRDKCRRIGYCELLPIWNLYAIRLRLH